MKKKYEEKPEQMKDINIPLKNEIRSRARILTDEAFRETRNYLNLDSEILNSSNNQKSYNMINSGSGSAGIQNTNTNLQEKINIKKYENEKNNKFEIQEILNKLTVDNYPLNSDNILRRNYDHSSMEDLKVRKNFYKFLFLLGNSFLKNNQRKII